MVEWAKGCPNGKAVASWEQGGDTLTTLEVLTLLMLLVEVIALVHDCTKH